MHVSQAGDGFNLPLATAVIICCCFWLKATISGSLAPSGAPALQLIRNNILPKRTQTTRNLVFCSGKEGAIFISIGGYHSLTRHKAFLDYSTLTTLQISPRV